MHAAALPPPRIEVLLAPRANVAAVFRRGPSEWCQVLRWDTATGAVDPGSWVRARVYAEHGDVSPMGHLFSAVVHKRGETQAVVCKLPWLHPLWSKAIPETSGPAWRFVPPENAPVAGEQRVSLPPRLGTLRIAPVQDAPWFVPPRAFEGAPADAQWSALNHDGRGLVVTADGKLQIHSSAGGRARVDASFDCAPLRPEPRRPPTWAKKW